MDLHEYAERDATDLAALIAGGEVTRAEVEACAREAAERLNPELNFLAQPLTGPLPGAETGPFAGVPFLTKDLGLQVEGVRQRAGSRMLDAVHFVPPASAALFERFRAAGLTLMGTTTTPEFGFNGTTEAVLYGGPTRNPFDPGRSPGGSSGGSAAAVAAGVVPLAHANDGGGSIRIPAAACGLFGLKPSRGRTPVGPAFGMPLMGMAAEFVVTRSVRDAATLLQAVQGEDPGAILRAAPPAAPYPEAMETPTRPLRIALADRLPGTEPPEPEMAAALRETARLLEGMGHAVEEAAPDYDHAAWDAANRTFWFGYLASSVAALTAMTGVEASRDTLEAATLACAEAGRGLGALDYEAALATMNTVNRALGVFMQGHDLILLPVLPRTAVPLGLMGQDDPSLSAEDYYARIFSHFPYCALFNMTGQPAASVPAGSAPDGLPLSVQLAAPVGDEATVLQVARDLERARPWAAHRPAHHAARG